MTQDPQRPRVGCGAAILDGQGRLLLVSGMLDGSELASFIDHLNSGTVRTVVLEDSLGGTAEAAGASRVTVTVEFPSANTEAATPGYEIPAHLYSLLKPTRTL